MIKLKAFQQRDNYCGPASLKMVLEYYGIKKSEKAIARMTKCTSKGIEAEDMLKVAKKLGLKGFIKDNSTLDQLKKYVVKKHIPVIVDWFCEDDGHYSVVIDVDNDNIYLQDPYIGHVRAVRKDIFLRIWFDFPGDFIKRKKDLVLRRMLVLHR